MKNKKRKKKLSTIEEIIKASRKGSREAEIELHGHPLPQHRVYASKKTYNRKKFKVGDSQ